MAGPAVPNTRWYCEGYRLRDGAGQLRGQVQVRYGVVRAVAAGKKDADEVDPLLQGAAAYKRTCRGQIVFQEKTRPMAVEFTQAERDHCIRHAIEAIRATPKPDRAWPPETLGAKGNAEQTDVSDDPARLEVAGFPPQRLPGLLSRLWAIPEPTRACRPRRITKGPIGKDQDP